jgi:cell cycle arrest protein BUB2
MGGISPTKDMIPTLNPPNFINNPPSPRTHRALRRLQSAHTLGQSNNQPSLISQQHKESLQRKLSPATTPALPHHSRGRSNSDASNMTIPSATARRPVVNKKPIAADALSLDRLIRDGPPDGDIAGALESTRLKILDQGIKSDSDGMVGDLNSRYRNYANISIVVSTDICLAHSAECTGAGDGRLSRPHTSWSISCILQNPQ